MKFKERKRKHDDAHFPVGGKGQRAMPPTADNFKEAMKERFCNCGDKYQQYWDKFMKRYQCSNCGLRRLAYIDSKRPGR